MTQNFKGDALELRMQDVADPLLDITDAALNDFYADGFSAAPFLLAMYDDDRMPFSERIARDSFVDFVNQAFINFPFTGTFEAYLSILRSIFGTDSEIRFLVPAPGVLYIDVEADVNSIFDFIAREFVTDHFDYYEVIDDVGDNIVFRGITGIETEYELYLLFSEIMPAGIVPHITLGFYEISEFAGNDDDLIVTEEDYGIIFIEGGS